MGTSVQQHKLLKLAGGTLHGEAVLQVKRRQFLIYEAASHEQKYNFGLETAG